MIGLQWPAQFLELLPIVCRNDVCCLPRHDYLPLRVMLLTFVLWCNKVLCCPGLFDIHQIRLSFLSPQRTTATRTMDLSPPPELTISDEISARTHNNVCAAHFDPVIATLSHAPQINPSLRKLARHWFNRFWFETNSLSIPTSSLLTFPAFRKHLAMLTIRPQRSVQLQVQPPQL